MPRALVIVLLFASTSLFAQDLGSFEKVLFPVLSRSEVQGVNNTRFFTRLRAFATEPLLYYPAEAEASPAIGTRPAGLDSVDFFERTMHSGGRLLYFDRSKASAIRFFYQLEVTGPDGSEHATTLPVVREAQFVRGSSAVAGLRTSPAYDFVTIPPKVVGFNTRNRLRIYDVDNTGSLVVHVRATVAPLLAYGPFIDTVVAVVTRDADDPTYPYYAEIPFPDVCITAPTGNVCRDYPLDVSIEPNDPNLRYWAFATSTKNATGETMVFFPQ